MRRLFLALGVMVLSGVFAGCDGGGESAVAPEEQKSNPNVGIDALKKMGPMPTPKSVSQPPANK